MVSPIGVLHPTPLSLLYLLLLYLPVQMINISSMMFLLPLRITLHLLSLGMLILTGLWISVTVVPYQGLSSSLLVLQLPGNVVSNPQFPSVKLKLNFLLQVMLEKWPSTFTPS